MTVFDLTRILREREIEIELRNGQIILRPRAKVTAEIEVAVVQFRSMLVFALQRRSTPAWPLHEIWMTERNRQLWYEFCYREGQKQKGRFGIDEAA